MKNMRKILAKTTNKLRKISFKNISFITEKRYFILLISFKLIHLNIIFHPRNFSILNRDQEIVLKMKEKLMR